MSALLDRVRSLLRDAVLDAHEHRGDTTVLVARERVPEVLRALRDDPGLRMNFLMDLTAVDYLGRAPRFELVYHLASVETDPPGGRPSATRQRLRVKAGVPAEDARAPSACELYASAGWLEREVWDMYGIAFAGNPDPRRILLYEEFQGHPLRKDYPKERRQPLVGPRN